MRDVFWICVKVIFSTSFFLFSNRISSCILRNFCTINSLDALHPKWRFIDERKERKKVHAVFKI